MAVRFAGRHERLDSTERSAGTRSPSRRRHLPGRAVHLPARTAVVGTAAASSGAGAGRVVAGHARYGRLPQPAPVPADVQQAGGGTAGVPRRGEQVPGRGAGGAAGVARGGVPRRHGGGRLTRAAGAVRLRAATAAGVLPLRAARAPAARAAARRPAPGQRHRVRVGGPVAGTARGAAAAGPGDAVDGERQAGVVRWRAERLRGRRAAPGGGHRRPGAVRSLGGSRGARGARGSRTSCGSRASRGSRGAGMSTRSR